MRLARHLGLGLRRSGHGGQERPGPGHQPVGRRKGRVLVVPIRRAPVAHRGGGAVHRVEGEAPRPAHDHRVGRSLRDDRDPPVAQGLDHPVVAEHQRGRARAQEPGGHVGRPQEVLVGRRNAAVVQPRVEARPTWAPNCWWRTGRGRPRRAGAPPPRRHRQWGGRSTRPRRRDRGPGASWRRRPHAAEAIRSPRCVCFSRCRRMTAGGASGPAGRDSSARRACGAGGKRGKSDRRRQRRRRRRGGRPPSPQFPSLSSPGRHNDPSPSGTRRARLGALPTETTLDGRTARADALWRNAVCPSTGPQICSRLQHGFRRPALWTVQNRNAIRRRPTRAGTRAARHVALGDQPMTRFPWVTGQPRAVVRHMTSTASSTVTLASSASASLGSASSARRTSLVSRPLATTFVTMSRLLTVPARLPVAQAQRDRVVKVRRQVAGRIGSSFCGPEDFDFLTHHVADGPHFCTLPWGSQRPTKASSTLALSPEHHNGGRGTLPLPGQLRWLLPVAPGEHMFVR